MIDPELTKFYEPLFIIEDAKYIGCPPWEFVKQPYFWQAWVRAARAAENQAQKLAESK